MLLLVCDDATFRRACRSASSAPASAGNVIMIRSSAANIQAWVARVLNSCRMLFLVLTAGLSGLRPQPDPHGTAAFRRPQPARTNCLFTFLILMYL